MCDFLITPAAANAAIVTPCGDRVLVSVRAAIKCCTMDTALAAAVRMVMVGVNLQDFESRHVSWIGFGKVGKRWGVIL